MRRNLRAQPQSTGRFSCNTWEATRVTCGVGLQAGNQFHLFSNFEKHVQFNRYQFPFTNGLSFPSHFKYKKYFRIKNKFPAKRKENSAQISQGEMARRT